MHNAWAQDSFWQRPGLWKAPSPEETPDISRLSDLLSEDSSEQNLRLFRLSSWLLLHAMRCVLNLLGSRDEADDWRQWVGHFPMVKITEAQIGANSWPCLELPNLQRSKKRLPQKARISKVIPSKGLVIGMKKGLFLVFEFFHALVCSMMLRNIFCRRIADSINLCHVSSRTTDSCGVGNVKPRKRAVTSSLRK